MPRYFFHIRDEAGLVKDEEGTEFSNLAAARKEAALSAREIVSEAVSSSEPLDHLAIEIWDEQGMLEVVQLGLLLTQRAS